MSMPTTSESDDDMLIGYECEKAAVEDFSNNTNYIQNVLYVVDNITSNAPKEDGFKKATYSYFNDPVYGIAQCRGDVVGEDCSTCLTNAAINMSNVCPNFTKGAMVIRNKCFLIYTNQSFFEQPYGSIPYFNCKGDEYEDAENTTNSLIHLLIDDVNATTTMFASGSKTTSDRSHVVEAMAECRRDLNATDCTNCLTTAVTELLKYCYEAQVGRYFIASNCNVRYERV